MPYNYFDIQTLKQLLEQSGLAGFIYQHQQHMLILQETLNDNGSALNNFIQHDYSSDQLGLQFGLRLLDDQWQFLIGVTHSNQDRSYEIGAGNLKGDERAFNLLYAFYNYPKAFYSIEMPLAATTEQLKLAIEKQLFDLPSLEFLNTAIKINPMGEEIFWMKSFIIQQSLEVKVRIQTSLL